MNITSAEYLESGSIKAVMDGVTKFVPDDAENSDRQALAEWEADGNTISPYVAPDTTIPDAKQELAALDIYIPRGLEDMWAATGFDTTTLPQVQQDRLARKAELRAVID